MTTERNPEGTDEYLMGDPVCCPICYEEIYDDMEAASAAGAYLHNCNHVVCTKCLEFHCQQYILARPRFPAIPCPCHAYPCGAKLDEREVKQALQSLPAVWKRYLKAVRLWHDPSLLSCPRCNELVEKLAADDKNKNNNIMTCAECQHAFCQQHGDLHDLSISCQDFCSSPAARAMELSEKALQKYCKPCSRCGCHISKESRCHHVICTACGDDMCWRCGTHEHLTGKIVRRCLQCEVQYVDHRYRYVHCLYQIFCCLPLTLPFYLVYMVIMVFFAVISACFCCCCGCKAHLENDPPHRQTPYRATQLGLMAIILLAFLVWSDLGFQSELVDELIPPLKIHKTTPKTV